MPGVGNFYPAGHAVLAGVGPGCGWIVMAWPGRSAGHPTHRLQSHTGRQPDQSVHSHTGLGLTQSLLCQVRVQHQECMMT